MSYNIDRRIERAQMKAMITEFKKESGLSTKRLDFVLFQSSKKQVVSLRDRFDKMLALAAGKNKLPGEVATEEVEIGS